MTNITCSPQSLVEQPPATPGSSVHLLGTRIDFLNPASVVQRIAEWRCTGVQSYIALANPHSLALARRDQEMRGALSQSGLTLPDGVGVTMAASILNCCFGPRVPGPELVLNVCDLGRSYGYRHYFYGGAPGVSERMAENLDKRFPGMLVAGASAPPFRQLSAEEDAEEIARINAAKADIVWVGLGAPKQEKWMAAHVGRVRCSAMLGVGAAFDFHSGNVRWAPSWVRRIGMEWVVRVALEPRRIAPKALDGAMLVAAAGAARLRAAIAGLSRNGIPSA